MQNAPKEFKGFFLVDILGKLVREDKKIRADVFKANW